MAKTFKLKNTPFQIGPIGYGCWRLASSGTADARNQSHVKLAQEKIETALEAGMNLIDTADIYSSRWPEGIGEAEALLGQVINQQPNLRSNMVLATKGGIVPGLPYDSSQAYLVNACEASLERLQVETIDLYQIHRPDLLTSFTETAAALNRLKQGGKIQAAGVSNFTTSQFNALQAQLEFPLVSHQNQLSPWCYEGIFDGILDQCQEHDLVMFAWSPLAPGILIGDTETEELSDGDRARQRALISVLDRVASAYETDRSTIILAFLMQHPGNVVPIIGTQSPARIRDAAKAYDIHLTKREWYDILEARLGHRMP